MDRYVAALTVYDDGGGPALYAGGDFFSAGGAGVYYIAKWTGSRWSALGSGMDDTVWALTVYDDGGGPALYAGGDFTTAGGTVSAYIAKWATTCRVYVDASATGANNGSSVAPCWRASRSVGAIIAL
jgi:hypothetical protein